MLYATQYAAGRTALACLTLALLSGAGINFAHAQKTDVLTYHNDQARTGQNLSEEILTPGNVNSTNFGKLRVLTTDGKVDAQPLYAAGVATPGLGQKNVLIVVTEMASMYAFDADTDTILWQVSLLGPGETPSDNRGCSQVSPSIGITATPVIDRGFGPNGTILAVAMTANASHQYFHRLHALDLATGTDRVLPVTVSATYPGTGDNNVSGFVVFDPGKYKERPGLLLLNGIIYTSWASHCDARPYTGWIMGYDEATLTQTSVLNITPNGSGGAFWMANGGLAADADGNILVLAGNGEFDTTLTVDGFPNEGNYGNAFIKVSTVNGSLAIVDYFAPFNTPILNSQDADLGSGGAVVLPDMVDGQGITRQLAVGAGKDQNIYLVDRANMGKFNPANDDAVYQKLSGALPHGVYSTPAFFNNTLYYGAVGASIKAFPFQDARLTAVSSETETTFAYPGATPSISANGEEDAIVWAVESSTSLTFAVLHAYDANDLTHELYNSDQAGSRDHFGAGNKFITPTIASARAYVGTTTGVGVFGLLDQSTLTPLQVWRDNHFGNPSDVGAGANGATPAGDGIVNLIKYSIGLDPFTATNLTQFVIPSIQQNAGESFGSVTLNRLTRPPDITYLVEVSSDLVNWSGEPTDTVTLIDVPTQLVVRDATPLGASPRFMRVRVSNP